MRSRGVSFHSTSVSISASFQGSGESRGESLLTYLWKHFAHFSYLIPSVFFLSQARMTRLLEEGGGARPFTGSGPSSLGSRTMTSTVLISSISPAESWSQMSETVRGVGVLRTWCGDITKSTPFPSTMPELWTLNFAYFWQLLRALNSTRTNNYSSKVWSSYISVFLNRKLQ